MSGELACLYLELWVGQDCDGIDCYPACCQGSELTYQLPSHFWHAKKVIVAAFLQRK